MTETTNTAPTNLLWGTAYEAREGIYAALDVVLQKWADNPEKWPEFWCSFPIDLLLII